MWGTGGYVLPAAFKTAIIEIDKLPESHPRRAGILRLLASWKVSMEVKEILDAQKQEELMALSQVFLDWG